MKIRPQSYQVLITPLESKDTYGTTVDVTKDVNIEDYVKEKGMSTILKEVDNGDFDIGVFIFNSITLTCINFDGRFSDSNDSRTMFKYSRDRAKVVIDFFDGTSNTALISFKGIIDDRATKLDFNKDEIKLTILSQDSILNRLKFVGGTVPTGALISTAIKLMLNRPEITSLLNFTEANITVANDYTIDDVSKFDDRILKDILDELLVCSNSVLIIDTSDNIVVRSRNHNTGSVFNFYGEGDYLGRQNIIELKDYNTGLQRTFNTVQVADTVVSEPDYIDFYGDNKKSLSFDFITNTDTQLTIARDILSYWKSPKIECIITAKTSEVRGLSFFDLVSVNYPYKVRPVPGEKLAMYGSARYGQARYPHIAGSLKISNNVAFKVIGTEEDPVTFLTKIKLRQVGTFLDDGYLSAVFPENVTARYGFAIYGLNKYSPE